jgi:hypothetical protein
LCPGKWETSRRVDGEHACGWGFAGTRKDGAWLLAINWNLVVGDELLALGVGHARALLHAHRQAVERELDL